MLNLKTVSSKQAYYIAVLLFTLLFSNKNAFSQTGISRLQLSGKQNVITSAVPFLTITPDSRRAGMGDAGVASSADANSIYWNASSLAFADKKGAFGISYAPWLRSLVPGISYNSLSGYTRINSKSTLGGGFRFFSFGDINFTDDVGSPLGTFNPSEYAIDVCYAIKLSNNWAIGATLKYINSNLAGTRPINGITPRVGRSGAGDISATYKGKFKTKNLKLKDKLDYTFGANIQNLGAKITYSDRTNREFLPTNLKIGTAWTYKIDQFNTITGLLDFNKLMVPSPGINKLQNYLGKDSVDTDNFIVYERTNSDDPVITAAGKSFVDAPGGFREELKEYNYSIGFEYDYVQQFKVRFGYFNEAATKGNRKYFTAGFGLKYKSLSIDAAYIIPLRQAHPLQNQLRFSLLFDIGSEG